MTEKLKEELNEILHKVWLAGWKIRDGKELDSFEEAMSLALLEGWNAESEDDDDYSYATM